mgnify:CR=1 FL=1
MIKRSTLWTKGILLALALALPLGLAACGGDDEKDKAEEAGDLLEELDADASLNAGKFVEGMRSAGVEVGKMTPQDAQPMLSQTFAQLEANLPVTIQVDGENKCFSASQLGISVEQTRTFNEAQALGENKSVQEQAKASGYDATVYYTVNPSTLNTALVSLESEINTEAVEPQVEFDPGSSDRFHFTPGQDGKTVDTVVLSASIEQAVANLTAGQAFTVQAAGRTTPT